MAVVAMLAVAAPVAQTPTKEPRFYMKAHIDEACSCPLFCKCYFSPEPTGDRCNFNNVYTVEKGNYGDVKPGSGLRIPAAIRT